MFLRSIFIFASVLASAQTKDLDKAPLGSYYLVMDKSKQELTFRSYQENKILALYRAISGTNIGDKEKEGDKKTPEGIYFIENPIPKSRLQPMHGLAGYRLNYPNPVDQIKGRKGNGIWIHGVEKEERMNNPYDTLGCVALSNNDVVHLGKYFYYGLTPIVIVADESKEKITGHLPPSDKLYLRIKKWAEAWQSKDVDAYLNFYHSDFVGRKMNLEDWRAYKKRLATTYEWIKVGISELKILRHGKYTVAIFLQDYESNLYKNQTYKRLYLEGEGETALIIAEEPINPLGQKNSNISN